MSKDSRFCHKCGTALPAESAFCPKCGAPVAAVSAGPAATIPPSAPTPPQWGRRERQYEKQEKHEKNEKNEKGRGGDLAGAITGGLVLILLGILFYFSQTGTTVVTWSNFWAYLIIGIGAILILQGAIRYAQRRVVFPGSFIGGVVLIIVGSAFVSSTNISVWPLILVVLGIGAIVSAFVGRGRVPRP